MEVLCNEGVFRIHVMHVDELSFECHATKHGGSWQEIILFTVTIRIHTGLVITLVV